MSTMSAFNAFFFEMVNGRGWICIALVIFASWQPGKALLGTRVVGADGRRPSLGRVLIRNVCKWLAPLVDAYLEPLLEPFLSGGEPPTHSRW